MSSAINHHQNSDPFNFGFDFSENLTSTPSYNGEKEQFPALVEVDLKDDFVGDITLTEAADSVVQASRTQPITSHSLDWINSTSNHTFQTTYPSSAISSNLTTSSNSNEPKTSPQVPKPQAAPPIQHITRTSESQASNSSCDSPRQPPNSGEELLEEFLQQLYEQTGDRVFRRYSALSSIGSSLDSSTDTSFGDSICGSLPYQSARRDSDASPTRYRLRDLRNHSPPGTDAWEPREPDERLTKKSIEFLQTKSTPLAVAYANVVLSSVLTLPLSHDFIAAVTYFDY